ncbi:hypothetical protein HanRHA438_Chr06g0263271 [Helianthus annuus]|nr:hypothetical protein HanHA300_Chr06g0208551 [Helianthus annuus]KAJ0573174.1 hypothetical protein HanHA89_Chr06g0223901 [Helianthus annuus]KAJ0740471.1 hypothetical protein HanOQP8_Chr06g0217211 [Helianthus annuus]KAJ0911443.1 hypothetical protein HanRHA438_Chr06g0263271 [Helianthus annuus]
MGKTHKENKCSPNCCASTGLVDAFHIHLQASRTILYLKLGEVGRSDCEQ